MPLVGRFYENSEGQSSQGNAFYSNLKYINEVEAEAGNPEYRLVTRANLAERMVSRLRKQKSELIEKAHRGSRSR